MKILKTMLLFCLILIPSMFSLMSCSKDSNEQVLDEMEEFLDDVSRNADTYTYEEWKEVSSDWDDLDAEIDEEKLSSAQDERYDEISEKVATYILAGFSKYPEQFQADLADELNNQ